MDDSTRTSMLPIIKTKRRYRSLEEKLKIIEEALLPGASVAAVARAHNVNANLVFHWRKLYRAGLFSRGEPAGVRLLPVQVKQEAKQKQPGIAQSAAEESGTIEVQLRNAQVRIAGKVQGTVVHTVLECLLR
jgi:transposase